MTEPDRRPDYPADSPGFRMLDLAGLRNPRVRHAIGSLRGLHLIVSDIEAARATLIDRGVEVASVEDLGGVSYASFADPDGNSWTLQHMPRRQ